MVLPLPLAPPLDQPGLLQNPQMTGDRRGTDIEGGRDLADGKLAGGGEPFDDRAPGRIGKRSKHIVQLKRSHELLIN